MTSMHQRLSLITMGYDDLSRARAFYEALGWTTQAKPEDDIVFFQVGGMVLALWDRSKLADDAGVADAPGWGGITLAHCVRTPGEVDAILDRAREVGATITPPGRRDVLGGYSGVFLDPGEHAWEVAYQPHWILHDDGTLALTT